LLSWVGRFLVFQDTPLPDVLREVERQYGVQVELGDSTLAMQTVTGWYADKSFEDVMRIVCSVLARQCSIDSTHAVIGTASGTR
jgi:ferric-dicitrate binding protein FerR (iron transport regulator)